MEKLLTKYNLSPNQYHYLVAIHQCTAPYRIHPDEIKELSDRGFLILDDNGLSLTNKSEVIFGKQQDITKIFNEIWNMYPAKTPNGRALRPKASDSKIGTDIFRKLSKYLADDKIVTSIRKGLAKELAFRLQSKKLEYMNNMKTWVNNRGWELYEDEDDIEADTGVLNFQ